MTTTAPLTIDMSGVVGSILHGYEQTLVGIQHQVTGDPAAISAAAQQHTQQAGQIGSAVSTLTQTTSGLAPDWDGSAHDAFAAKSAALTSSLATTRTSLSEQAQRLTEIAQALTTARQQMDALLAQFRQIAQTLITESQTASPLAQAQFISAAQNLGNSAVTQANGISGQLAAVLARGTSIRKPDDAGFMRFDVADPLKKMLAGQPWFRNMYRGLFGGEPDPEHLTMGPLGWLGSSPLNPDTRPSSGTWYAGSEAAADPNSVWGARQAGAGDSALSTAFKGTDITLYKPEDTTLYDGSLDGRATTSGTLGDGVYQGQATGSLGPHVTDGWSLSSQAGQLQANGSVKATLADGTVAGAYDDGPLHAQASAEGLVGATASGNAAVGLGSDYVGGSVHAQAFAGAQATAQGSVDVGGIGVGGEATAQAGIGAQLDAQANYSNGHLVADWRAGAALGIGGAVGAHIDVDVPKIAGEVESGAGQAWNSLSQTAGEASAAVGTAWHQATGW